MRVQPALRDRYGRRIKRQPLPSCVPPHIKEWVYAQMKRFNCSGSWVVAVALSEVSGIDVVRPEDGKKKG